MSPGQGGPHPSPGRSGGLFHVLFEAAMRARALAYAPYSGYPVGAALLDGEGRVHCGCNVENVSYGLSVCAERNAVAAMVLAGGRDVREVLLVTEDGGVPCGACLQVLSEFCGDPEGTQVHLCTPKGLGRTSFLSELSPATFRSDQVSRTDRG